MYRSHRHESLIDEQIRRAQESGEFDNLPGKGKPLPDLAGPDDELWWVKRFVEREGLPGDALLPPSLQLRKEIERLPTLRDLPTEAAARVVIDDLNRRIVEWVRLPSGPAVPLRRVDVEQALEAWRAARAPSPAGPVVKRDAGGVAGRPRPARRRWWWFGTRGGATHQVGTSEAARKPGSPDTRPT
jgi:hypothetical protein